MTQIYHTSRTELVLPSGRSVPIETRYRDTTITEIKEKEISITASATITIWDKSSTSENINTLSFCQVINTGSNTIEVEYVVDDGGEVGEELHTVIIPSTGHHVLMSGVAYANHSAGDAFGGTKDVIERIRIKEPNGVVASVIFVLGGA